ncbi:hypothetical protein [Planococcus soli]|uniref:hypothetical protein n=1 Tax=Planococcus soli TaxID=2666072 RepID=UPI00115DF510|nr:hypothetical protein [Planococcus soli]
MTFLETETIQAPTLYKTNTTAITAFNSVMETITAEEIRLIAQEKQVQQRNVEIPNEIHKLKQTLSGPMKQTERDSTRSSIEELEAERDQVLEALSLNVSETIREKMAQLGIEELKTQAAAEHVLAAKEITTYLNKLTAAYKKSQTFGHHWLDYNSFKKTNLDFERLKIHLSKIKS